MTTIDTVSARTSQAEHDFQLNKAMNMRCRSPEQHKSRGTANSYTGNSTSASLRATSSPSSSSVCRRGGEGQGALWFPVLWVILPHPAPVVPCVCSMCCGLSLPHPPVPPFAKAKGLVGGRGIPWGTSTVTWMTCACLLSAGAGGGGGGHTMGGGGGLRRGDAAPYMVTPPPGPTSKPVCIHT